VFSVLDLMIYYLKSLEYLELFYYTLSILFFTFLGYFGIKQSDIYSKARLAEITPDLTNPVIIEDEIKLTGKKQVLSEERSRKLMMEIIEVMNTEKIYRNAELSIFDIAKRLDVNKTYISFVINENLQENFSNFINRFRINEAKELLQNKNYHNYTLEGIANMVGFHSKSSFNIAFKKFTGMIPSQFKKNTQ
jgi:YesN/AraC family two-component response regulator